LVSTWLPLSDGRTVHIRQASVPDSEQAQAYKILDVDWKKALPTVKSIFNPYPICSAFAAPPRFHAGSKPSVRNLG